MTFDPPDLIELRTSGIVALLDEECKLPKGSHTHFTEAVHSKHKNHFRLSVRASVLWLCSFYLMGVFCGVFFRFPGNRS